MTELAEEEEKERQGTLQQKTKPIVLPNKLMSPQPRASDAVTHFVNPQTISIEGYTKQKTIVHQKDDPPPPVSRNLVPKRQLQLTHKFLTAEPSMEHLI